MAANCTIPVLPGVPTVPATPICPGVPAIPGIPVVVSPARTVILVPRRHG